MRGRQRQGSFADRRALAKEESRCPLERQRELIARQWHEIREWGGEPSARKILVPGVDLAVRARISNRRAGDRAFYFQCVDAGGAMRRLLQHSRGRPASVVARAASNQQRTRAPGQNPSKPRPNPALLKHAGILPEAFAFASLG